MSDQVVTEATPPDPIETSGVSILVVDDDLSTRIGVRSILLPLGFSVVEADSGQAALRCVMRQDFAVILLDVRMPVMNGFETAAFIRRRQQSEMTPIIFMTDHTDDEIGSAARYVEGAVDFMFTPLDPVELRAKVAVFADLFLTAGGLARRAREVQASANKLRLLTDTAPIGIFQTDASNRFTYTNPRWAQLTGIPSDEAIGRDWETLIGDVDRRSITELPGDLQDQTETGRRFKILLPSSTNRIVLVTSESITDAGGGLMGWVGTLADVTAETDAGEERARFRALVLNSRSVIAVVDAEGRITYVSPAVRALTGYDPEELVGGSGFDLIHPDDMESMTAQFSEIVQSPTDNRTLEVRTRTKEGGWKWIEVRATNRLDEPILQGIILNFHDVTERRNASDKVAESEHSLGEAQALAHFGSYAWDMRTDVLSWSDEQFRLIGLEPGAIEPVLGTFISYVHPDDRELFTRSTQSSMKSGEPFDLDFRIHRVDGETRWIHGSGQATLEDGIPVRLTGMSHDITSRKEAEQERSLLEQGLRQSEQLFRGAFDATNTGIALLDPMDLSFVDVNAGFCEMLGYTKTELMGLDLAQVTHPEDRQGISQESWGSPAETKIDPTVPRRFMRKDGGVVFTESSDSLILAEDGTPQFCVTNIFDLTERIRAFADRQLLEEQLNQSRKMEAVGQLAGGVAHDFNNLLAVILNYAQFVTDELEETSPLLSDVQQIVKAGEKAATLVHQLLAFSRKEVVEPRVIDLNDVVREVQELLSRSIGEDIGLVFELADDLPLIKVDPGHMEQILLNLAVNGRDAMPRGGTLSISTCAELITEAGRHGLSPGTYVRLVVADTGTGIDPTTLERVFEPFFTTKPRGAGTGLGLATVYGIIKQANGSVLVDSEQGVGTTFTIHFPLSDEDISEVEQPELPTNSDGTETILLVEDEDAVRDLVSRILVKHGFEVATYADAAEAIHFLRQNLGTIDLLLTDVVMPGMSGKALSDEATLLRPGLRTLYMSGYTDELIAQRGVLEAGENLISKPFKQDQLLAKVRSLLDLKVVA